MYRVGQHEVAIGLIPLFEWPIPDQLTKDAANAANSLFPPF